MRDATHHAHVPTAEEIMTRSLVTFRPEMRLFDAIALLLKHRISGGPVVDDDGKMVGILSELDCLKVLAAGEFYSDDHREEGHVRDCMTTVFHQVLPETDIYALAQTFLTESVRRLPVLRGTELLGQVSRRDVLRAMEALGERRATQKHYPDYREPASDVGAKRSH